MFLYNIHFLVDTSSQKNAKNRKIKLFHIDKWRCPVYNISERCLVIVVTFSKIQSETSKKERIL